MPGAILLALTALVAPQTQRIPTAGRVVDAEGAPVAAAEVHVLHRPFTDREDPAAEDRFTAITDEQGMFRVLLRDDATYSAWARWGGGATPFVEGVQAGQFLELVGDRHVTTHEIAIDGLDAWAHRGPIQVRACVGSEHLDFAPLAHADGRWTLPTLPRMSNRSIEILDRDGITIWARGMVPTIVVPEPTRFDLRVVDEEGKGLAGAEVSYHIRNYWLTQSPAVPPGERFRSLWPMVGTTDAEGRLSVEVAVEPRFPSAHFVAALPGHRPAVSGRAHFGPYQNGIQVKDATDEVVFTLHPQPTRPLQTEIFGVPLRDGALAPTWRVHAKTTDGGGVGTPWTPDPCPIGEEGIALSLVPENSDLEQVRILIPRAAREAIHARFGVRANRTWRLGQAFATELPNGGPLPTLADLHALQVFEPDGRPAIRAVVMCSRLEESRVHYRATWSHTNRSGRCLVLAHTPRHRAIVVGETGWASVILTDESEDLVRVACEAFEVVEATVLDEGGQPVPHALVRAVLASLTPNPIIARVETTAFHHLDEIHADAKGRARILLPRIDADWNITARAGPIGAWEGETVVTSSTEPFAGSIRIEIPTP